MQVQEISLNFHCKCEQYIQFATGAFFNFNGTAVEYFLLICFYPPPPIHFFCCTVSGCQKTFSPTSATP